ncbi:MAG TPA: MoxR family ATPase [Thermomicrobiales bacterium]|nr:MoxR family ATPase [Thermomicrobiales bacterium]
MTDSATPAMDVETFRKIAHDIETEVGRVMVAQNDLVRMVLICVLANGHALIEGVPGLGKTRLVRTLADVLDVRFSRIQFTPDLMPADITGTNILVEDERGRRSFNFQHGPVFANFVLADEINRATPKTQAALLEAMQDRTVTIASTQHQLPNPFFVLATQNPLEMEGTYPLPEAQLDRFMFKLIVPYPSATELAEILQRTTSAYEQQVQTVADGQRISAMTHLAAQTPVAKHLMDYVVRLTLATHPESPMAPQSVRDYVQVGVSPRGGQSIIVGARIRALMENRLNVAMEDIQDVARHALRHRLLLNFNALADRVTADAILDRLLAELPESAMVPA